MSQRENQGDDGCYSKIGLCTRMGYFFFKEKGHALDNIQSNRIFGKKQPLKRLLDEKT